jgi:hypothetical protein
MNGAALSPLTGESDDHEATQDLVHPQMMARTGWSRLHQLTEDPFRRLGPVDAAP